MLISKDEQIKESIPFLGYLLLKELSKKEFLSIYDVFNIFKKNGVNSYRQIIFVLIFLNAMKFIDFDAPNIRRLKNVNN